MDRAINEKEQEGGLKPLINLINSPLDYNLTLGYSHFSF